MESICLLKLQKQANDIASNGDEMSYRRRLFKKAYHRGQKARERGLDREKAQPYEGLALRLMWWRGFDRKPYKLDAEEREILENNRFKGSPLNF